MWNYKNSLRRVEVDQNEFRSHHLPSPMKTVSDTSLEFRSSKDETSGLPLVRDEDIDGFESVDLKKSKDRQEAL
ncbi:hypothetical protein QYM36_000038, partial [Artemia franciscana]